MTWRLVEATLTFVGVLVWLVQAWRDPEQRWYFQTKWRPEQRPDTPARRARFALYAWVPVGVLLWFVLFGEFDDRDSESDYTPTLPTMTLPSRA